MTKNELADVQETNMRHAPLSEQGKKPSDCAAMLNEALDLSFNLALRMLGTVHDAEDCTQEVMELVLAHWNEFRGESAFSTWVYRIAARHALDYRKGMFAHAVLSFEEYGRDIASRQDEESAGPLGGVERAVLAEELKMSCTNVMLQCLKQDDRAVFVLGAMFELDSRVAGEALGISAEAYRQKLSRVRKRMADFLREYCGHSGAGMCRCERRINLATEQGRIRPDRLEYVELERLGDGILRPCKQAMENLEEMAPVFSSLPNYRATPALRAAWKERTVTLLDSEPFQIVLGKNGPCQ